LYLSDVLPTAWQAVEFANIPGRGSVAIFGLGPIGQMAARIARYRGARAIGVDLVPERLALAQRHDIETLDAGRIEDVAAEIRERTDGRGTDATIDAVGMEAHGSPVAQFAQAATSLLPSGLAAPLMETAGVDRLAALHLAIEAVRRGGTVSIVGVYGGMSDPLPMLKIFDKGLTLAMGQAHVKRWVGELLPLVLDAADPLGVEQLATHHLPLSEGPAAYAMFQEKRDGAIKVVLHP